MSNEPVQITLKTFYHHANKFWWFPTSHRRGSNPDRQSPAQGALSTAFHPLFLPSLHSRHVPSAVKGPSTQHPFLTLSVLLQPALKFWELASRTCWLTFIRGKDQSRNPPTAPPPSVLDLAHNKYSSRVCRLDVQRNSHYPGKQALACLWPEVLAATGPWDAETVRMLSRRPQQMLTWQNSLDNSTWRSQNKQNKNGNSKSPRNCNWDKRGKCDTVRISFTETLSHGIPEEHLYVFLFLKIPLA